MSVIKISGASDDLIEHEVDGAADEINAEQATLQVIGSDGGQLQVHVSYGDLGVWVVQVGQVDEDVLIPDSWDIKVQQQADTAYSIELVVTTPGPARLQRVPDPA